MKHHAADLRSLHGRAKGKPIRAATNNLLALQPEYIDVSHTVNAPLSRAVVAGLSDIFLTAAKPGRWGPCLVPVALVSQLFMTRGRAGFRVCENSCLALARLDPASAGVTALDSGAVFRPVIPAKAGIHEFSHRILCAGKQAASSRRGILAGPQKSFSSTEGKIEDVVRSTTPIRCLPHRFGWTITSRDSLRWLEPSLVFNP